MKKQVCMMMAAVMAAAALTGCSGGTKETAAATEAETTQATATAAETEAETSAGETTAARAGESTEILVAAAASLKNAYEDELIPMFQEQYPGVTVKGTYDSSGKLQTQIEEGLEADVFMSAAAKQMTALDEEGMIESDTITSLLENKIVLIVPTGSSTGIEKFEDIEKAETIALGDPASVPAGQYAEEALTSLGIWDKIQDKVSFGTNVTEVLNQVAASSADAGIVYATDAASMADKVEVVAEAPEGSLAKKVIYPVAVVKNTAHPGEAKNFVEFLKTDEAMKVFEEYGFTKGEYGKGEEPSMDWSPILISMKTASLSIFITFFLGIFAAWAVVSMKNETWKLIWDGVLTLPLVLPPTVAGFFLLYMFGVKRPVGQFFIEYFSVKIAFSWTATVIAAVVMSFPLMYRSARGAFEQVDQNLVAAARTLGMSEWSIFWKVLMTGGMPGVVSGGVLAFARGLGEFGATAMIAGNIAGKTRTLPMAVYSEVAAGNMDTAYRYVAVIVVIAFLSIILMNWAALRPVNRKG